VNYERIIWTLSVLQIPAALAVGWAALNGDGILAIAIAWPMFWFWVGIAAAEVLGGNDG
jgi:hypothetical protein